MVEGMDELLDELAEQYPPPPAIAAARPGVACIGGKWEVDQLAARMLAHALQLQGCPAGALARAQHEAGPALDGAQVSALPGSRPTRPLCPLLRATCAGASSAAGRTCRWCWRC
ncbi:phytochrome sensor protein [Alicycliphilus sp. B1]|nr:phytochrome sensor protein [Alicycliphilus sp. B1]